MFPTYFKLNAVKFPYKEETKLMWFSELLYNLFK